MSQHTEGKLTMAVKAPSACSKSECLKELGNFQIYPSEHLTVVELRALVRKNREDLGVMKPTLENSWRDGDMMLRIQRSSLRELKAMADNYQVGYPDKIQHGDLSLHLKQWTVRSGKDNTPLEFGKHQGHTFLETWEEDQQYVRWSVQETAEKHGSSWKLVQRIFISMRTWIDEGSQLWQ